MDQLLSQESLPLGSHPPALPFEHFPNRMYAVIWRNWNLVDPDRIAQTIGCNAEDIHAIAASMGLPPAQPVPAGLRKQIYITVLRRNWHLLPYEQLLTLVDMSPRELEFSLKEDDFLFLILLRDSLGKADLPSADKQKLKKQINHLLDEEIKWAAPIVRNSPAGFPYWI